jgi:hypothetical protein
MLIWGCVKRNFGKSEISGERDYIAHRSFESCCKPAGNAIIVYGHSLATMMTLY